MKEVTQLATLEWVTPNAAKMVELAGRTCYKSDCSMDSDPAKFIASLIKRGHNSVLEHASASFRIVCDRGITHELVRHRIASFSQESTRYCNYAGDRFGGEITVIRPEAMKPECFDLWLEAMGHAERIYLAMLELGEKPQNARSVLPTCLKTEIVMTCNMREWRHFLSLRDDKAAHPDMQILARQMRYVLQAAAPEFFPEKDM